MAESSCPFCGYEASTEYDILYHLEMYHAEGESPFVEKGTSNGESHPEIPDFPEDSEYINCPIDGCGEAILRNECAGHLELHVMESENENVDYGSSDSKNGSSASGSSFNEKIAEPLRNLESGKSDGQAKAKAVWKELFHIPDHKGKSPARGLGRKSQGGRLGTAELGPHANEDQMPFWLRKLLENDGKPIIVNRLTTSGKIAKVPVVDNYAKGILPVIEQLLVQDPITAYAYLCDPSVQHISKLKHEGGFCGYRNIQMMTSYIISTQSQGYYHFDNNVPTIFQIQEFIERAWDLGIQKQGRIDTGGIRGTRKYIGTPEATAMFISLDIATDQRAFRTKDVPALALLTSAVENYFIAGCRDMKDRVRRTDLPPIYFQHRGHSMTIVGFECRQDGSRVLLVFDPSFHDSPNVTKLVGKRFQHKTPAELLRAYRRGPRYLSKFNEFEVFMLAPPKASEMSGFEEG